MSKTNDYIEITFNDVKKGVSLSFIMTIILIGGVYVYHLYSSLGPGELGFYVYYTGMIWLVMSVLSVLMSIFGRMLRDSEGKDK